MPDTNPLFAPSISKLGHSLSTPTTPLPATPSTSLPATNTKQQKQEHQTCILTLLRILDNILNDGTIKNPKLRKLKVSNPGPFWKRAGRWDGSVDFLLACGFVSVASVGKADKAAASPACSVSSQLKLEKEDRSLLVTGREELIKLALGPLGIMQRDSLPACPAVGVIVKSKKKEANLIQQGEKLLGENESGKQNDAEGIHGQSQNSIAANVSKSNSPSAKSKGMTASKKNVTKEGDTNSKKKHASISISIQSNIQQDESKQKPPPVKPPTGSFTLEQIQRMAQETRDDTIVEAKKLKEENKLAAVAAKTKVEQTKKKLLLAKKKNGHELLAREAERERRVLEQEKMVGKQNRRENDTFMTATAKMKIVSDEAITKNDTIENALSNEMTDLLDEIEMELNDDFFDSNKESNQHDEKKANGNDASSWGKGNSAVVATTNPAAVTLCEYENNEEIVERKTTTVEDEDLQIRNNPNGNNNGIGEVLESRRAVRLEQQVLVVQEKDGEREDVSTSVHVSDNNETPMHLPKMVEAMMGDNGSDGDDGQEVLEEGYHHDVAVAVSATSASTDGMPVEYHGHQKNESASDLLDDLESETEIRNGNTAAFREEVSCARNTVAVLRGAVQHDVVDSGNNLMQDGEHNLQKEQDGEEEARRCNIEMPAPPLAPPMSNDDDSYTHLFKNIPLPEGEFSSSDDYEDVMKFRHGFELCHTALFSIWSAGGEKMMDDHGAVKSQCKGIESSSSHSSAAMAGLSNIKRWRQIWEDENDSSEVDIDTSAAASNEKVAILVPLAFVYKAWACILGLESHDETKSNYSNHNTEGVSSGMMYSWVVSNHPHLSTFDNVLISDEVLPNRDYTRLPEASVAVCNYVCKALRDVGLISVYRANVRMDGMMSAVQSSEEEGLASFFVGIDSNVFNDCIRKRDDGPITLDDALLHECHGILTQAVYPRILDALLANKNSNDYSNDNASSRKFAWYSCQHAVQHLLASGHLEDAKSLLFDSRFIRLRLQILGLLGGTSAHCRDCARMDVCILQSMDEWRRTQLQAADDIKREQLSPSSLDDYGNHDPAVALAATTRAPDVAGWKEDHFKILCSISTVLREKAGEVAASFADNARCHHDGNNESKRRNLQKDIADALLMIGGCIGNIGVYRIQEMEHYEEALQLKSEAFGDDQNHVSIAEILYIKGCHHQRFHHFKFAQKCYEQSLRIYKGALGYEHPCVARVLHNIGIMYHSKKDNAVALKCLKKSLSIRVSRLGETD
eukprot:CAMPEP_0172308866 /NCGR_PEP_ID=MMETSP1058-20130122/9334_1 /TAXON_ID=83371 /ORGANISM="Detonula confervacea, Strain CCMP 353" /LENGTH=1252 /DNA_ID=CAMNT_0013021381 /DNA_START=64 /DNA_END=3819 /DNA_ORIENTATION=+